MKHLDHHSKRFLGFLLVLFLFFSTVVTLTNIQQVREPISRAVSAPVTFIIFNDLDQDGRLDTGENFNSGPNPRFFGSQARIIQRTFSGSLDITSSFDFGGIANRTIVSGIAYDWDVMPFSGYRHTKYSVKFYNPGGCSSAPSSIYICSYGSDGSTANVNLPNSNAITIYLGIYRDPIDPTVSITSPSNGSTVSSTITVRASASDNIGVVNVRFYVDGSLKKTDTSTPFTYSWNTTGYSNGNHILRAKAKDAAGNVKSHSISVTVSNSASPPVEPPVEPPEPPPPPPPPPPNGGSSTTGSVTQQTTGITGAVSSIKVEVSPVSFLVGEQDAVISVAGRNVTSSIKLKSDKASFKLSVKGAVPQGITQTISLSGKKFVNKKKTFSANSENPTVNLGNLIFGDINNDEKVDLKDLSLFIKLAKELDNKADINLDGTVNSVDYSALLTGLLNQGAIGNISQEGRLSLVLTTESATLDEEFTVDILADGGQKSADGVDVLLSFDPAVISLVQINETKAFKDYFQMQELEGLVKITALADKDNPAEGTNVVASLTFKAFQEGETKIEFSLNEDDTTDSNITGRFTGRDVLTTVDNLRLNITADGITATTETVGVKGTSLARIIFLGILIIGGAVVLFFLGLYIKRNYLDAKKEEIFVPDEVPMDKPPAK